MKLQEIRTLVVDPSLRMTGYYRSDTKTGGTIDARKVTHNEALYLFGVRLDSLIDEVKPDLLLVEDYSYSANTRSTTTLGEIRGVFAYVAVGKGIEFVTVPVQTWKARTIGKKKKQKAAEKAEYLKIARWICQKEFESIDEADAHMIYYAAVDLFTQEPDHKLSVRIAEAIALISQGSLI